MKCLWIEDFDRGTKPELEQYWRERYDMPEGYDVVILKSLTSALAYIDDMQNDFDAVIIDIDLDSNDVELGADYKKYIEGVVSDEFLASRQGRIESIGGFLIFLKLILERGFPRDKIIFLTNNYTEEDATWDIIDDTNSILKEFDSEGLCPHIVEGMEDEKKSVILDLIDELANINYRFEDKIINLFQNGTVKELLEYLNILGREKTSKLYDDVKTIEASGRRNTYNDYKEIFRNAGINPSRPYMKDNGDSDNLSIKRHTRKLMEWKKSVDIKYCRLRRSIREICSNLLSILLDEEYAKNFYIFNKIANKGEEEYYSMEEVRDSLYLIKELLPLDEPSDLQKHKLYLQIMRIISQYWETKTAVYLERFRKESYYENFYCFMKLLRNWTAHGKIREEITEADVGFFFIIAMRTYFNLGSSMDSDKEELKKINFYELQILELQNEKISIGELDGYFRLINSYSNARRKTSRMENLLKLSFTNITKKEIRSFKSYYKSRQSIGYNVYTKMKNIGDESSREVSSIKDLYKLLWHSIYYSSLSKYDQDAEDLTTYYVHFSFNSDNRRLYANEFITQLLTHTFYKAFSEELAQMDVKESNS